MTHSTAPETYRAEPSGAGDGYVDWGAILAGTAIATALSFLLLAFGSAIGLTVVSFEPGQGGSLFWLGIVSGLWFLWVTVTAFGAGGYVAGRLRRPVGGASVDEIEARDGTHGLIVWSVGVIVGAVLAAGGVSGIVGAAGRTTGTLAETASQAVGDDLDYIGGRLLRAQDSGSAEESGQLGEVTTIISRSLETGELEARDRDYLAQMVASRTGETPEQAAARVDDAFAQARQLYDQAIDAAEQARVAAAIAAFVVAASLLVGAVAAYGAATSGGDHRDSGRMLRF